MANDLSALLQSSLGAPQGAKPASAPQTQATPASQGDNPLAGMLQASLGAPAPSPQDEWTDQSKLPTPPSAGGNWLTSAFDWAKQKEQEVLQKNYALGRGLATGSAGILGETEKLATQTIPSWWGQEQTKDGPWGTGTVFPTNETISKGLTAIGAKPSTQPTTEAQGQFLGSFFNPAKKLEAGAAALREASGAAPRVAEAADIGRNWLTRTLGGGERSPAAQKAADAAQQFGFKLLPTKALGFGEASKELVNAAAGKAAQQNYNLYEKTLADLIGVPKGTRIDTDSLAAANKDIVNKFKTALAGKTVRLPHEIADAVSGLLVKQPAISEALMSNAGVSNAVKAIDAGKPVSASDWYSMVRQLKAMRYSAQEANVKSQLTTVIDGLEKAIKNNPSIGLAYKVFNAKYSANSTVIDALKGDKQFLETGRINPAKIYAAIINDAKSSGKAVDEMSTTTDKFTQLNRTAYQLDLTPSVREKGDDLLINSALAAAHGAGVPGIHMGWGSMNVLPRTASALGAGKLGRALYESNMGQRLLAGRNAGLPNLPGAASTIGPAVNILNQTLPSSDSQ